MGGKITLDRDSIEHVLKYGNPNKPYLPLTDTQSKELYRWRTSTINNKDTKFCQETISNELHLKSIGYFKGSIIAFSFTGIDRPFIMAQYDNQAYNNSLKALLSHKRKSNKPIHSEELEVYYFSLVDDDFYWVTEVLWKKDCYIHDIIVEDEIYSPLGIFFSSGLM
jgi:hypothetical protein